MTISAWQIWLMSVSDGISMMFGFLTFIFGVAALITFIILFGAEGSDIIALAKKWFKRCFVAFILAAFMASIIPSKKDWAAIILIPAVVNNEKIQNITGNGLGILEELTKDWLKELQGKQDERKL